MGQEYTSCYIVQEYIHSWQIRPFPENNRIGSVFPTISEKGHAESLLKIWEQACWSFQQLLDAVQEIKQPLVVIVPLHHPEPNVVLSLDDSDTHVIDAL